MSEVWMQQSAMYCSYRRERKQTVSQIAASAVAVWRLEGLAACKNATKSVPKTFQLFQMFEYQN